MYFARRTVTRWIVCGITLTFFLAACQAPLSFGNDQSFASTPSTLPDTPTPFLFANETEAAGIETPALSPNAQAATPVPADATQAALNPTAWPTSLPVPTDDDTDPRDFQTPGALATGDTTNGTSTVTSNTTPNVTTTATPCLSGITGYVLIDGDYDQRPDWNEHAMVGALITLKNNNGQVITTTNIAGDGLFNFTGLFPGTYYVYEDPPVGYYVEGYSWVQFDLVCGAIGRWNFMNAAQANVQQNFTPSAPQVVRTTPLPVATRVPPTPRPTNPPSGSNTASSLKGFSTGPTVFIGGCGSINSPGLYRLSTSLVSQWDCIQINSDGVTFDCQGNSLNGTDGNGYGIVVHHVGAILGHAARNVEIRNCKMGQHKYGIFVDAADNLYIHDNTTSGNFRDVDSRNFGKFLGLPEGGGIRVNDTRGATLSGNHSDNNAIGYDIRNGSGITVRNNSANANTAWGIHFYNVTNSEISGNVSSNNVRYCTWGSGVVGAGCDAGGIMLQSGSSGDVVRNNTISGSNGNGIFVKAHGTPCGNNNVIANNRIVGFMYNGIELSFCSGNRLQGNEISNGLDGIWLGFAVNNQINAGNFIHDNGNHGIISWNSQTNNVSDNRIVNSREALYFYSGDYDRQNFYFVSGSPSDHVSAGNCLCSNTLQNNAGAAFHLANSIKNQMTKNTLTNNGKNFIFEGNTSGNVIQDNIIQGGALNLLPRAEPAAFTSAAPSALRVFDANGNPLSRESLLRALVTSSPDDSFDLLWFKYRLRASLGLDVGPTPLNAFNSNN